MHNVKKSVALVLFVLMVQFSPVLIELPGIGPTPAGACETVNGEIICPG